MSTDSFLSGSFSSIERRDFLKLVGAITAFAPGSNGLCLPEGRVAIVLDECDPVAGSAPVKWAAGRLRQELLAKGARCDIVGAASEMEGAGFAVLVGSPSSSLMAEFPKADTPFTSDETLRLTPGKLSGTPAVAVSGSDTRGFVYGLLELAERVQYGSDVAAALRLAQAVEEKSANEVRSVARAFCSEVEDKGWYNDKDFWRGYLDMLAASRFNRFNFAFGFGYDFPRGVTGDYFHFPYPYLMEVPGYKVRVVRLTNGADGQGPGPLSEAERDKNFEMLRFIAAETAARGLEFQLGIWTHAYQWTDSPHAHHQIEGLTAETHAAYCRDALAIILKSCPQIQGLTLRVHGESGIPEGSYPFWKTLFEAISGCGRKIEVDMHSKGVNQIMIDMAKQTGMPVKLGAKYSAEHQSLGYQQADIRQLEIPDPERMESGLFSVSNGARRFTRYGYADFYQQDSQFKVLYRLWPGTQRHLLSADPELAAAFGRTSHFCGAAGLELCEPLTFKGREGSGIAGGRCAYVDEALNPKDDWKKFELYYRVWGRRLYNPEADPEAWRRYLESSFGGGAEPVEKAVANASRVLPLMTSAHLESASNHALWNEVYTNMPTVIGSEKSPYGDTPNPKCFGTVSPLDPQMFSTIVEYAGDLVAGRPTAKYSPVEVAEWLETYTATALQALAAARGKVTSRTSPEFRRVEEDVLIQVGLGQFFAGKLRSGVLYEIYRATGDAGAGKAALEQYQKARDAWATMAQRAQKVYRANISYGNVPIRSGHWIDRLPAIEKDVAAMQAALKTKPEAQNGSPEKAQQAVRAVMQKSRRPTVACTHTPLQTFQPGKALALEVAFKGSGHSGPSSVLLHYRHVNQAERWRSIEMEQAEGGFRSAIPADYTHSEFPLQYYFELRRGASEAWLHPAFNASLSNQPYFAVYNRNT